MKSWTRNPFLLGAFGATLSWLIAGVNLAGPDQQLYIPFVRRFAHPELYPGDFVFDNVNARATLWVPLMGLLHRWCGGDLLALLAVSHAVSLFLFFFGVAAAARRLMSGSGPLWIIVVLSWPPAVAGAAASLYEPSPHPRTFAVAIAACAMACALAARALPAAMLAVLAMLLHPLEGLAALAGCALALSVGSRDDLLARRRLILYVATVAVLAVLARVAWPTQAPALPLRPVAWWSAVATAPFLWLTHPTPPVLITLAGWIALFVACTRDDDVDVRRLTRFGLAGAGLAVVGVIGMVARSPLLVSLQLHRGLYAFELATLLLVARKLTIARAEGRLSPKLYAAVAIVPFAQSLLLEQSALAVTVALTGTRRLPSWLAPTLAVGLVGLVGIRFCPHRERTDIGTDWVTLQRWAAAATPRSARFLAPFHSPDFRVFSARASVLGAQDGQPAIFDEKLARSVVERSSVLAGYAARDCALLADAARRYQARYVVTEWDCGHGPPLHRQGTFRVYSSDMLTTQ